MSLLQFRYFLEVAETQNISRTARKLHVSQPSLSRSISDLEKALNVQLFVRNGNALKLSKIGSVFYRDVQQSMRILDRSIIRIREMAGEVHRQVIFRFETSSPMIPGIIHLIKETVPEVSVRLIQHGLENNNLEHYDFEFSTHPIKGNINHLLVKEEILVAVSEDSPLSPFAAIDIHELKHAKFILTGISPLRSTIESFFQKYKMKLHPSFVTSDRPTLHGLIAENMGIGIIPQYSWAHPDLSKVKLIHFAPEKLYRKIYLSYYPDLVNEKYHKLVEQAVRKYFNTIIEK